MVMVAGTVMGGGYRLVGVCVCVCVCVCGEEVNFHISREGYRNFSFVVKCTQVIPRAIVTNHGSGNYDVELHRTPAPQI
jgi:hypothetical protein